jgi:hypothetical protein
MEGELMRKLMLSLALVGALGNMPAPRPADATMATNCMDSVIYSCDDDFSTTSEYLTAIRGWCYLIRGAWCVF